MSAATPAPPSAPLMLSVSGCRGIFGQSMTPEVAARFAATLAGFLMERSARGPGGSARKPLVILGRDGRAGGHLLAQSASAALAAAGCDCIDLGVSMTPTIAVFADNRIADAGLVITASHNPQEWNGLKILWRDPAAPAGRPDACAPPKSIADAIIARFKQASATTPASLDQIGRTTTASRGEGLDLPDEGTAAHLERLREALASLDITADRREMALRAVVDSVNASGARPARFLLGRRLVHHLGAGDSGIFPHPPEPTNENLSTLCRFVADKRADAGFAQDPDADRLAIIDEQGRYIGEEYTLVLAAEAILGAAKSQPRGRVLCTNLSTSRMLEDVAAKHGTRVVRTAVGEAHVVEAMKAHDAILGGEGNGGVIWPRVTYIRDSLSAMALTLALVARTGKPISALVADIPAYSIVKRKVDLPDISVAARAVEAVARHFGREQIDRQDGVRVDLEVLSGKAWLHVRASNTEPIMRLIAEAPQEADAVRLLDDAAGAMARG